MTSTEKPGPGAPTIPLHAEDIAVTRRSIAGDTVRVGTTTRSRDHHIDEPLSHTRVHVERVPIGRTVAVMPAIREEGDTTILPVVEEVIVVERRLILKEEVYIRRVQVAERHTETVTTRKQTAEIYRAEAGSLESEDSRPPLWETDFHLKGKEHMTEHTIVAVYDRRTDADAAVRDLATASVPSQAISRHENGTETTTGTAAPREEGFWARLFGGQPDHDTSVYDRSIENGSSVIAVRVSSDQVDHISAILETHHPIDIEERSAQYTGSALGTTSTLSPPSVTGSLGPASSLDTAGSLGTHGPVGTPVTAADTASETGAMQLAEETLEVGKHAVGGATTRVRRFVVETPVQEQVNLRDESVTLERHPVTDSRPVGTGDFNDKALEMTEMSEQAVVSKTARVVEEVNLRKDVTDRVETVKDTIRRDEVEIEKVPGETTTTGTTPPVTPTSSPKI